MKKIFILSTIALILVCGVKAFSTDWHLYASPGFHGSQLHSIDFDWALCPKGAEGLKELQIRGVSGRAFIQNVEIDFDNGETTVVEVQRIFEVNMISKNYEIFETPHRAGCIKAVRVFGFNSSLAMFSKFSLFLGEDL